MHATTKHYWVIGSDISHVCFHLEWTHWEKNNKKFDTHKNGLTKTFKSVIVMTKNAVIASLRVFHPYRIPEPLSAWQVERLHGMMIWQRLPQGRKYHSAPRATAPSAPWGVGPGYDAHVEQAAQMPAALPLALVGHDPSERNIYMYIQITVHQ